VRQDGSAVRFSAATAGPSITQPLPTALTITVTITSVAVIQPCLATFTIAFA
jgi:hypothetical protein